MSGAAIRRVRPLHLLLVLALGAAALLAIPAPAAEASHFRATQATWHETATPNEVEFHLSGSFRCTFYFANPCNASPGDTFFEYSMDFGDGNFGSVEWTVISSDAANDVVNAESHMVHQYASAGVFDASVTGCCRLSSFDGHLNNGDDSLAVTTLVDLTVGRTESSESQLSPIVDCPIDAVCEFSVPATDADGDTLQWRFPTSADPESNSGTFTQPPGATVDMNTGLYSFDTTGVPLAASGDTFYSTNVVIEAVRNNGVVGQITVDFFIRIGDSTNSPPVFEAPTPADGTTINATVGSPVTFSTQATDPDTGDVVTLAMLGKPSAATYTTSSGNPATGTFAWTPTTTGTTLLTLTAADQQGRQATQRTVTIVVGTGGGGGNTPPTAEANGPYTGDEGAPVAISGTAADTDGDALTTTWSAAAGAGVDAGATCAFADASALSTTVTCDDDGPWTLTLTADDGAATGSDTASLTLANVVPVVAITSPGDGSSTAAGTPVNVTANLSDAGANDTHTCEVDFGDGTVVTGTVGSGTCDASHAYAAFGMYTITVTVTDDDNGVGSDTIGISVVAPGTITGGGWLTDATGQRVHLGFVAGFDDTTGAPRGQLQVSWIAADGERHRFHGDTVDALAMGATSATWSGGGRLDGVSGATYEIEAQDNGKPGKGKHAGDPDALALTIRDASGAVVYQLPLTDLARGNIVRHS